MTRPHASRNVVTTALLLALMLPGGVLAQSPQPSVSLPVTASPSSDGTMDTTPVITCPVPVAAEAGLGASPVPGASPAASGTPAAATPLATWDGAWAPMPAAPIVARSGAATDVAIPEARIYVWGGRASDGTLLNDGAVFLVKEQRWETLPATDLVPRESFGSASDGRGITIWGGVDASGMPLADGARLVLANDEQTMTWQTLPAAPLTPGPASLSGDINTTYVVTPGATADDPPRFAVLDTDNRTDSLAWDDPSSPNLRLHGKMPAPRVPAGVAYEIAGSAETAVLISYQADGSAVASWFTNPWPGKWSKPVAIPLPATAGCPAVSTTRDAWVRATPDGTVGAWLARVATGGFRTLTVPPAGTSTGGMLVWSPSRLIVADALIAYDIPSKRWTSMPALPDGPRTGVSAAWSDGKLYLWGGRAVDGQASETGWVFTPAPTAGVYPLAGAPPGDCGGQGDPSSAVFRAKESDPDKVWMKLDGRRITAIWPEGYTVRFADKGAQVIAPSGKVVAREGQRLSATKLDGCLSGDRILLR